jgi:hypothetical protein
MPLAHRDLQTLRTPLVLSQRKFSANRSRAIILGTLLFATVNSSWAQDAGAVTTGKPNPLYPDESLITFQWSYACPENRPCTNDKKSDHSRRYGQPSAVFFLHLRPFV